MFRHRALQLLIPLVLAAACGAPERPVRIPPPTPMPQPVATPQLGFDASAKTPTPEVDPVRSAMTAQGAVALCTEHIGRAQAILDSIKNLANAPDQELTWDSTLGKVDSITLELSVGGGMPSLMSVGHPDKAVRDAAKACEPVLEKFHTEMMLDASFATTIKRYAARGEPLQGTRARLLRELLRDLRRNGLELDASGQQRLRGINEELAKLQQDFSSNIADAVGTIKVKPAQLKGLPQAFVDQHKPGEDGLVTLSTNYPDYFPVITYCEDRTVARDLTAQFDNRAADKNLPILHRVLELRVEKAKLLGYPSWAAYAIEPRMAHQPERVREFLDELSTKLKAPGKREYDLFKAEYRRLGHSTAKPIPNHERLYIEQKIRERKYGFDAKELSKYFEVRSVTGGLLQIVEKLYGISFRDVTDAPRWHPSVRVLDVMDGDARLGRVYLDLHPREGKYKHAAMFEIRAGKRLGDGRYLEPVTALVCNFPDPAEPPALMTHADVTTLFHEFGHVLHHILTRQELATYAGTNTARDFVETPSQVFEEWSFRRSTLDLFARHFETGEPIPQRLFDAMTRSRAFGRALHTERQVSLASLDFAYHTAAWPLDTDAVFRRVMNERQRFDYLPDTHFQGTFGHLMGYDAGYYSYQWAMVIAQDVLTRFEREGFLNHKVASEWRTMVLEQGAGEDENKLVERFLGRPHNLEAYSKFLQEGG